MSFLRIGLSALLIAGLSACVTNPGEAGSQPAETLAQEECPVTTPEPGFEPQKPEAAVYTQQFPAPDPYPNEYPRDDGVWYGSDGLWTVLPLDGLHDERKAVFWSAHFRGGTIDARPDLDVTWTRLDTEDPVVVDNSGLATNAYTADVGWFMITGLDEALPAGCWQVDASYEEATLTYVYEKS